MNLIDITLVVAAIWLVSLSAIATAASLVAVALMR